MASGQHGLSGQTAQEPVEAGSCTGNAPAPARGNKWYSNFRWFSASQIHCDSCHRFTVQMKKPFMCDCFYNPTQFGPERNSWKLHASQNPSFLNTWRWCLPGYCQRTRAHSHALGVSVHPHTLLITALIRQADSPDRQTISPHAPDKENLLIACSFLSKLPRQSANIPHCCSLTQT